MKHPADREQPEWSTEEEQDHEQPHPSTMDPWPEDGVDE